MIAGRPQQRRGHAEVAAEQRDDPRGQPPLGAGQVQRRRQERARAALGRRADRRRPGASHRVRIRQPQRRAARLLQAAGGELAVLGGGVGEPERRHRLGQRALGRQPPRPGEQQPRVGGDEAVRQHALQRPERAGDDLGAAPVQQLLDRRPVLGAHVRPERGRHFARLQQQLGGAPVPVAAGRRAEVLGQLQLQVVQQHLVVAELPAVVGSGGEQPALLQLLQHGLASDGVEQRVAQRARQHAERAGAAQELAQLGGQVAEHLPDQVGTHEPGPARQVGQRPAPLRGRTAFGEQVEHREPGRPATGALRQRRGVLGRQRLVVDLAEQPLDLP